MVRLTRFMRRAASTGATFGAALMMAPAAHAGIFDDDEARKAILDLRQKLEQSNEAQRRAQADLNKQMLDQLDQVKRSLLDLNGQLDALRQDNARLRGQDEELQRNVADLQKSLKDSQQATADQLAKYGPQQVTIDGKQFTADPDEKRLYDEAMGTFRNGDFAGATTALSAFRKRFPSSGYDDTASFWLGNAQYGQRNYKEAVTTFRGMIAAHPDSPKAPEALLAVANCQIELKDAKGAKRTIDELLKNYPKSEAAQAGRDRLASLR